MTVSAIRMDKWLWAARFFKTRALASKACDLGRILSNGIEAKPARDVRTGDKLHIKNEGGEFQIEVLQLSECADPPRLRRPSIAKPKPAKSCGSKLPKSVRRCNSSIRNPSTGPRNGTAARLSSSGADRNFQRCRPADASRLTPPNMLECRQL